MGPSAVAALGLLLLAPACSLPLTGSAQLQSLAEQSEALPVIETGVAEAKASSDGVVYTGTTEPVSLVSLRSQTEGQLLNLQVDVGDEVQSGAVLGRLDDDLLYTAVNEAEAELAARQFLVTQAQAQVADAQAQVEQAQAELEQARADANRLQSLSEQGALPEQEGERALTALRTAEQVLRSAQEQVRTREQAIAAAERRVDSQQAIVAENRERLSYASLVAPFSGVVLTRFVDPGDLIQPGQEVLQIGDLSAIHVMVQVSDRDRAQIRVGQAAEVQLDAFPGQTFRGEVTRISPVADAIARLIPIEVTLTNPASQIGSGLIARVSFSAPTSARSSVVVPEGALAVGESGAGAGAESPESKLAEGNQEGTLFVVMGEGDDVRVQSRVVQLGDRSNGQVEIISGLELGEVYVTRSSQPLQAGMSVQRSLLSES